MAFQLDYLDHVAIHVRDMEATVAWYTQVLGLQRCHLPKWEPYPIFMLAGKTGIAIFPAKLDDPVLDPASENVKIDHFAFQVSRESFAEAEKHYQALGLEYQIKDHHYCLSMYTQDPDGHTVELTTLVVPEAEFFGRANG